MILTKTFQNYDIRITTVNNEVQFVGKDVAEALDYVNTNDAVINHVWEEYKGVAKIDTLGGTQKMVCINEQGVYQLVFGSKKPEARLFQKWIIEDVLPSINQTGSYIQPTQPLSTAQILVQSSHLLLEHEQQIKRLERTLENQAESISQIKDFTPPEGYKVASACYQGTYRLYQSCSSIVCNQLRNDGHSWVNSTTGDIYYDETKFLAEVDKRIEKGQFSTNPKKELIHVWENMKPQPPASKTKTRKPTKSSIDSLLEEYLERYPGKQARVGYSNLYNKVCRKLNITIKELNSLVDASSFKNKKQYLIANYPIEVKNTLNTLLGNNKANYKNLISYIRNKYETSLLEPDSISSKMTDIYAHLEFDV